MGQISRKEAQKAQKGLKKGQISRKKAQEAQKAQKGLKKGQISRKKAQEAQKGFDYRITEVCF